MSACVAEGAGNAWSPVTQRPRGWRSRRLLEYNLSNTPVGICFRYISLALLPSYLSDPTYANNLEHLASPRKCLPPLIRAILRTAPALQKRQPSTANRNLRRSENLSHLKRPSMGYGPGFQRVSSARRRLFFPSPLSLRKTAMPPNLRKLPNPSETTFSSPKTTKEPYKNAGQGSRSLSENVGESICVTVIRSLILIGT